MRIVIALGGNALLDPEAEPSYDAQQENIRLTAKRLVRLLKEDHELVITHGNGPQAGNILLQQEETPPEMPLDVVVAETQGQIGYMLQRELQRAAGEMGTACDPATLLTRVVVDRESEAFDHPSKPVGPFYTEEEARGKEGTIKEVGTGEKRFRRVVPSPPPESVLEADVIRELVDVDSPVIACGGGGIPVDSDDNGVEAVIDKDRTASLLARMIEADLLLILTDVPYAYRDFTGDREPIERLSPEKARDLAAAGEFGEGSMEPKVLAAASFVEETGERAVIGSVESLREAVEGRGTVVEADDDG
ncbi:MAG: carbamate kinase [Candidatus Nanohaloarchaea archaeon]|nr:carbamate kinase [Candidatus Nanohaloarchaea archaeon]